MPRCINNRKTSVTHTIWPSAGVWSREEMRRERDRLTERDPRGGGTGRGGGVEGG